MDGVEALFRAVEILMRETGLFAAAGFLILGTGDLAIDLIWIARAAKRRLLIPRGRRARSDTIGAADRPGHLAVFVPAWHEADVIGAMLRSALARFDHDDYRIYVGCYPNDPATIAAVEAVGDPRIRLVVGPLPGPTTKADCLNRLWDALLEDEAEAGRQAKAIILHDAEDVVHPAELKLFDRLIERFGLVQLPVLPLIDPNSRWIAGHYADEFAEAHGKEMVVREALGAGLPSAGVGCAFSRGAMEQLAASQGGYPFDAASVTEDYELGLRMRALGQKQAFIQIPGPSGKGWVVTREYFPSTLEAAIAQKARWMTGIALSGWDRLGWSGGFAERWMRLRDRQSVLGAILLVAGYITFVLWAVLLLRLLLTGIAPEPIPRLLRTLLLLSLALLFWRLAMRFLFVSRAYGTWEGLRALPRILIGNGIAMLAARRAVSRYLTTRRTGRPHWEKTTHAFPDEMPAE